MTLPLVSVIVPNYNHAPFLELRLRTIREQSFSDIEIILLDDKSSDHSLKILKDFAAQTPSSQLWVNEVNSGSPFHQWMKGARLAKGKYLWIAESDDFAMADLLQRNVDMLENNPNAVMAFCQSIFVDEHDRELNSYAENYRFIYKTDRWDHDFVADGKDECRQYLIRHNSIPNASAVLFRKDAFLKSGGPPLDWKLNGDWMFYASLLQLGELAYCAEPLNRFRKHYQTQRQRANADARAYFEIWEIVEFIKDKNSVSPSILEEAMEKFSDWWIGSLFRQELNGRYFKDNGQLYSRFSKVRSYLLLRIVYSGCFHMLTAMINALGIKSSLKKLRSKLFPGKYFEY